MFWTLFLAHLIADYPLQPNRLVIAKNHIPGLTIHVSIHWLTMTILTWPVRIIIWPYVLAITIMHFGIDYFKVFLGRKKPQWVIGPYLWDQPLHWISLILVGFWMEKSTSLTVWAVLSPLWIYGIGFLMCTYIWYVTERVLTYRDRDLQARVTGSMWPRMGVRLLLTILLVAAKPASLLLVLAVLGGMIYFYGRYQYPRRWIVIDSAIALVSALTVVLILKLF